MRFSTLTEMPINFSLSPKPYSRRERGETGKPNHKQNKTEKDPSTKRAVQHHHAGI